LTVKIKSWKNAKYGTKFQTNAIPNLVKEDIKRLGYLFYEFFMGSKPENVTRIEDYEVFD